jgi:hypothetical protein
VDLQDAVHLLALHTIGVEAKPVTQKHLLTRRFLDRATDRFSRNVAHRASVIADHPQPQQAVVATVVRLAQRVASKWLRAEHKLPHGQRSWELGHQIYGARLNLQHHHIHLACLNLLAHFVIQPFYHYTRQNCPAIPWAPY